MRWTSSARLRRSRVNPPSTGSRLSSTSPPVSRWRHSPRLSRGRTSSRHQARNWSSSSSPRATRVRDEFPEELVGRVTVQHFLDQFRNPTSSSVHSGRAEKASGRRVLQARRCCDDVAREILDKGQLPPPSSPTSPARTSAVCGLGWRPPAACLSGTAADSSMNWRSKKPARQSAARLSGTPYPPSLSLVFSTAQTPQSRYTESAKPSAPLCSGRSITQASLTDVALGVRSRSLTAEGADRSELGYNIEAGQPELRTWAPEAAAADTARAEKSLEFVKQLTAVPDADPGDPQPEDQYLVESGHPAYRTFVAMFGTARRLRLPIYSDDRAVRRTARELGIPSFGTAGVARCAR